MTRENRSKNKQSDPIQESVIEVHYSARMLVLAGPGSGKTEVSARRIASLLGQGLAASNLLVLSFSRSAVRTLAKRLAGIDQIEEHILEELRHVSIRTFDSWTFRTLHRIGQDIDSLLRRSYDENIDALVAVLRSHQGAEVQRLLGGIRHVIVDEFQDLAGARGDLVFEVLKAVAPPKSEGVGFTLLGDPAQSIYGFGSRKSGRGSLHGSTTTELLSAIRAAYASDLSELSLDRNHRSSPEISPFLERLRSILRSNKDGGEKLAALGSALAELPAADFTLVDGTLFEASRSRSIALLARKNGEVLRIAQKILGTEVEGPGVALQIGNMDSAAGGPAWVAAILARLRSATLTNEQFARIYNRAASETPEAFSAFDVPAVNVAWRRLSSAAGNAPDSQSLLVHELAKRLSWPDSFPDDEGETDLGLCLSTIHQAKGREFDVVAILEHGMGATMPDTDPEEEACVAFVALSRAAKRVVRLPANSIYPPPSLRVFGSGSRKRLVSFHHGWVNMEMGISGDVIPESFADITLHGSDEAVAENYNFFLANAGVLMGHKVILVKKPVPGSDGRKVRYAICLQEGSQAGRMLGATHQNLVYDLLTLLQPSGSALPQIIMNLRILRLVSLSGRAGGTGEVSSLFNTSGIWLGVELFGTGDFKTIRKRTGSSK